MGYARTTKKIFGPTICEAMHRLSVAELNRTLRIRIIADNACDRIISGKEWTKLAARFDLPETTPDHGVGVRSLMSHITSVRLTCEQIQLVVHGKVVGCGRRLRKGL
jgi:hypothetical protein